MKKYTNDVLAQGSIIRRIVIALLFASIVLQALAFVVPGGVFSLLCRALGVLLLIIALLVSLKNNVQKVSFLSIGMGVVSGLIAISLVIAQTPAVRAAEPDNNSSDRAETVSYKEPDLKSIANTNKLLVELKCEDREKLVNSAKETRYSPRSGATTVWDSAQAYTFDSKRIISVPLKSDLAHANKILFIWENGTLATQEIYGEMLSDNEVHVRLWDDGKLSANKMIVNSDTTGKETVVPLGMNWGKLNQCFNSIGINWAVLAVISVACSWACAATVGVGCIYCLSAATGWTGGSISGCVYAAWE